MATTSKKPKGGKAIDLEKEDRLDQAQELIYDAWEAPTLAKAKALARKALKLSEDCADAYLILSSGIKTDAERLTLLRAAVAAGERALGPRAFKEMSGEFWGFLETRPYMRALGELAHFLVSIEQFEEGRACFQRMLELNPNDNQGARHELLSLLIMLGRDADAEKLYVQYKGDGFSSWAYARLLLDYRKHGAKSKKAVKHLQKALAANRHIADFLTGRKKLPNTPPQPYALGSEEEALEYLRNGGRAWLYMPDAIIWLKTVTEKEKI